MPPHPEGNLEDIWDTFDGICRTLDGIWRTMEGIQRNLDKAYGGKWKACGGTCKQGFRMLRSLRFHIIDNSDQGRQINGKQWLNKLDWRQISLIRQLPENMLH